MQIQILRRTCDNPKCDKQVDFDLGNLRPLQEIELSNWIVMTKEHVVVSGQPPQGLSKIACSGTCAVEIVRNGVLDMPKLPVPMPVSN